MSTQKVTEQTLQLVIKKLEKKYDAVCTMVGELQDNMNMVIQVSYTLLEEKNAKIMEMQAPSKPPAGQPLSEPGTKKLESAPKNA